MVTASQIKYRRRAAYPKQQATDLLAACAFTDKHRRQIAAGELILSTVQTIVIDITKRNGAYFMIDDRGRERCIGPYDKFRMKFPAVPVPRLPPYDPTVIPPESDYTDLSLPMRRALDYFAWASWKPKPHPNTVRALEKRNIIRDGRDTPYGSALYRHYGRHDKEL